MLMIYPTSSLPHHAIFLGIRVHLPWEGKESSCSSSTITHSLPRQRSIIYISILLSSFPLHLSLPLKSAMITNWDYAASIYEVTCYFSVKFSPLNGAVNNLITI
jgi:hypothetical protein